MMCVLPSLANWCTTFWEVGIIIKRNHAEMWKVEKGRNNNRKIPFPWCLLTVEAWGVLPSPIQDSHVSPSAAGSMGFEQALAPSASTILFREVVLSVSAPPATPCPGTWQEGRGAPPSIFCSVISISPAFAFRLGGRCAGDRRLL